MYGTDVTIICNSTRDLEQRYNYKNVTNVYYDPFNSKCSGYAAGYFKVLLKFVNPVSHDTPKTLRTFPDARRVFLKLNSGVNYTNDSAWVSWEIQKQPPDYDYIQHFDGKLFVSVKDRSNQEKGAIEPHKRDEWRCCLDLLGDARIRRSSTIPYSLLQYQMRSAV